MAAAMSSGRFAIAATRTDGPSAGGAVAMTSEPREPGRRRDLIGGPAASVTFVLR
jgi:hypothetical protein